MLLWLPVLVALLYMGVAFLPARHTRLILCLTAIAWVAHGIVIKQAMYANHGMYLGFALMLSAAVWVSVSVYWIESWQLPLDGLRILLLPSAALYVILPLFFPGQFISMIGKSIWFAGHIGIALLAYSTLTIAAFHAVLMAMQDAYLRHHPTFFMTARLKRILGRLPALLMMERILFRLVGIGFVLLTLTVITGVFFSEIIFGTAFVWDQKNTFSLLSWILFGILLMGRRWLGWRGKMALRLTLFGFMLLLLAYVGSRFVFEVVLHRIV